MEWLLGLAAAAAMLAAIAFAVYVNAALDRIILDAKVLDKYVSNVEERVYCLEERPGVDVSASARQYAAAVLESNKRHIAEIVTEHEQKFHEAEVKRMEIQEISRNTLARAAMKAEVV